MNPTSNEETIQIHTTTSVVTPTNMEWNVQTCERIGIKKKKIEKSAKKNDGQNDCINLTNRPSP